ncbi:hypothetical protein [Castellaniella caeni]|uniref:hypothetical protein n=1 Tax=Castellaniella caeni TaxID=266123 RepID=UPI0011AFA1EB|nr:hypothetical protein [Castellaniella caeni]
MGPGEYQADALQNITGFADRGSDPTGCGFFSSSAAEGVNYAGALYPRPTPTLTGAIGSFTITGRSLAFDASRVARTSGETRGAASRVLPVVLI